MGDIMPVMGQPSQDGAEIEAILPEWMECSLKRHISSSIARMSAVLERNGLGTCFHRISLDISVT